MEKKSWPMWQSQPNIRSWNLWILKYPELQTFVNWQVKTKKKNCKKTQLLPHIHNRKETKFLNYNCSHFTWNTSLNGQSSQYQQEKHMRPHPSAVERWRMGLCSSTVATLITSFGFWKSRAYLGLETDTDFQLFHLFSNFCIQHNHCSYELSTGCLFFQYIFKLILWLLDWKCTPTLLVSKTQKKIQCVIHAIQFSDYWLNLEPPQWAVLAAGNNNIHYMDSYFLLWSHSVWVFKYFSMKARQVSSM